MKKDKTLWGIAFPLMLNMLISQVQLIIDRAFLGRIQVEYMSALGNVTAPLWTSLSVIFAITTGATILMSQAIGADNEPRVRQLAHSVLKFNSLMAIGLFLLWSFFARQIFQAMGVAEPVLGYCLAYMTYLLPVILLTGIISASTSILQSYGFTRPIMIAGIVRSALNIILDWLLIFGNWGFPELGLEGAALATSLAEAGGLIIFLVLLFHPKTLPFTLRVREILRAPLGFYKEISMKGLPSAGEEFLWNIGNLGLLRLLNTISMLAAGIHTIIFSIEIIPAMVFIALGQGVMTLAGHRTGEGNRQEAIRIGYRGILDSWIISTVILVIFLVLPRQILGIFTNDPQTMETSITILVIAGLKSYPRSLNIVLGSAIRGYGDTQWMFKTQILGTILVLGAAALGLFAFNMGIVGVFWAVFLDEAVRGVLNFFRFRRGPDLPVAVQPAGA
ncbi:MATE family efflux transporter [Spirochaeta lutea]|uniref:MATE family efflux transporter n=1 Tax=Spirochaeta lutea TaxID=1480694 RepID=UPI00069184A0|nr:MATE family efflux transporter [Spirochaeta lutea]